MPEARMRSFSMGVPWNLFILTLSGFIAAFGMTCIAMPHEFVSGGLYGTAMLISYTNNSLGVAVLYAIFNIPFLFAGWFLLSRRFMLYTIYCIAITSLATQFMPWGDIGVTDPFLAAVVSGICCGAASGIALRSLGSDGGLNICALILHNKYNLSVGTLGIAYNSLLFLACLWVIDINKILYSMVIVYLTSSLMNYFMSAFDQRKMILIISDQYQAIADSVLKHLGRGCTLMHGQGAFTQRPREVLLTVVHNIQLKRLEELVFNEDPDAFVIIENTHLVLGKGFSKRKKY